MSGLLEPFFCPSISRENAFEIARAGESSPLMFKLFQERTEVGVVLHLCKRLKSAPVLELAHEGPKLVVTTVLGLLESPAGPDE
ncbi:MAG: hypothetical protein V3R40_03340, partial [Gammaproteobacteria bacterium]